MAGFVSIAKGFGIDAENLTLFNHTCVFKALNHRFFQKIQLLRKLSNYRIHSFKSSISE